MAKKISFVNEKGGVGKTTGAREVAGILGKRKKVLLIDLDFQRNLTGSFPELEYTNTIYDVFDSYPEPNEVIINIKKNIDIIPGDIRLRGIDKDLFYRSQAHMILSKFLRNVEDNYDYIIFDLHPAMGEVEKNALVCSEWLLVPIEAHYFSLDGLEILEMYQEELKEELDYELEPLIFFNRVGRGNAPLQIMEEIRDGRPNVLKTFIRDTVKIKEASMCGEFLVDYAKTSNGTKDFRSLVKELKDYGI